jgi:serine/threonine-protein kinase
VLLRRRDQLEIVTLAGTEGAGNPAFSPNGDRIVFMVGGSLKIVDLAGGPVNTLTDSLVGVPGLTWGPDGYIYYDQRGVGPLLRVRETGGTPEAVSTLDGTAGELQHVWPDVLPNGRGVIMTVNRGGPGLGAFETDGIAVLDLGTGRHQELFPGIYARYAASGHLLFVTVEGSLWAVPFDQDRLEVTGPALALLDGVTIRPGGSGAVDLTISRDGTLWYTTGGERAANRELVWATRDGQIAPFEPEVAGLITDAALSPDGSRVAFLLRGPEGGSLWVNRLGTSGRDRLTFERSFDHAIWSPDSRSLVVNEVRGQALQVAADGSVLPSPIPGLPRGVTDLHWSPDGAWLLYVTLSSGNADIHGFRPGVDSAPMPLVTTPRGDLFPRVSPNGRWLLSHSNVGGRGEVYARPFPNTAGTLRQVSPSLGRQARWSSTGREIFYRTFDDSLVVVPVLPGEAFALGEPRTLFSLRDVATWDVMPNGQRFLLTRSRRAAAAPRLVVVENFFEELKRSVPR